MLFLEVRISSTTRKEVAECRLKVSESLLKRYTTNFIQKVKLFLFLPIRQHRGGLAVANFLLTLVPGDCTSSQSLVVH